MMANNKARPIEIGKISTAELNMTTVEHASTALVANEYRVTFRTNHPTCMSISVSSMRNLRRRTQQIELAFFRGACQKDKPLAG
jgi:hypothetical protein